MYGHAHSFALPILSTTYTNTHVPTCATPTPEGLVFTFDENELGIRGKLTVVTDATDVCAVELGGPDPEDHLEIGDWGFSHMLISTSSTTMISEDGIDPETLDTLRSLIYSAIGYAQGHAARITARLETAPAPLQAVPAQVGACPTSSRCENRGRCHCEDVQQPAAVDQAATSSTHAKK